MIRAEFFRKKNLIITVAVAAVVLALSLLLLIIQARKELKYAKMTPLILMYHLILDEPFNSYTDLFVKPSEFDKQLSILVEKGYTFLFASEICETRKSGKYVAITFDDGYEDNYTNMFPILKKYNAKATISVITGCINTPGHLTSEQIKEMSDSGLVSIQTHTETHPDLSSLKYDDLLNEIVRSSETIENITGVPVTVVCYPYGKYNDEVLSIVRERFNIGLSTEDAMSKSSKNVLCLPRVGVPYSYTEEDFRNMLHRWEIRKKLCLNNLNEYFNR